MIETTVELLEVHLTAGGLTGGRITCPPRLRPAPGQYLLASTHSSRVEVIPIVLFPAHILSAELELAPPLPADWQAGMSLHGRGPLGKGFHLPALAHRIALAALDETPHRLLPLMDAALAQGAEVVLYSEMIPDYLPHAVEVLPLSQLAEAPAWADYLAVDTSLDALDMLARRLGKKPGLPLPLTAEILVKTAMPCSGLAECGVCAVKTRLGYQFACKDGPVFDLNHLEIP